MILSELKETMEKNKISREEAIMKVLSEFSFENGLTMTAVISFESGEFYSMPVIAAIRTGTPLEIIRSHGEVHSETIRRIIKQRKEDHENL